MNHDFTQFEPLLSQLPEVKEKFERRIRKFYHHISEPTLFIREISSLKDLQYIDKNDIHILNVLKSYNNDNKIIYISSKGLESEIIKIYEVETSTDGNGNEIFFKTNQELFTYLDREINFPELEREKIILYSVRRTNLKL